MLDIKNVKFTFDELIYFNYNFSLEAGDLLSIVGPSGSGKSTLLHLIAGYFKPLEGNIIIDNVDYTEAEPSKRPVNIIFQENNLFPHLKIFENIALGINPGLNLNQEQKDFIFQSIEKVGLSGYENRLPNQLSGGQKQRVAIARTIVRKGKMLVLDEPFSFLDYDMRLEMLDLVSKLHFENSFTTIMVTHDLNDCYRISNKVAQVEKGKITKLVSIKEFRNNQKSGINDKFSFSSY